MTGIILEVRIVQLGMVNRKTGLAQWKVVGHVEADISGGSVPTERELQSITYAAKMEYAKQMRKRGKRK